MEIKIVDSAMGTGKTNWAIDYMNKNTDNNFIYITPYLDEVKRIREKCSIRNFKEPINIGNGKLDSLKKLIFKKYNIASTHLLFSYADDEVVELLKLNNYILILDEVMEVIEPLKINKTDLKLLFNDKLLILNEDYTLSWNKEFDDYDGEFKDIRIMAEHNRLIYYTDTILMWRFPVDVFESFKEVWILTYLFDGQIQKAYYDMYNKKYKYHSLSEFDLCEYNFDKEIVKKCKGLINLYEGNLNEIGEKDFSLSYSWYNTNKNNLQVLKLLKNHKSNYLKHITKSKSKEAMWTTYKQFGSVDMSDKMKDKNYNLKSFVAHNARATNLYKERFNLCYLVNRFLNPVYVNFFKEKNINIDLEKYSLSELLQWIWRSRIREGESINLYIPSKRMRNLLINWLDENS